MEKIIIAAFDEERGIGKNNNIPWHYPEDLKFFQEKTIDHSVIMGRKTFESLPKNFRPLPDRENIVLTRSELNEESVKVANSLDEAFEIAENEKVFIAGGASVYEQTLSLADKMFITRIPDTHGCDTFFPDWQENNWTKMSTRNKGNLIFEEFASKN